MNYIIFDLEWDSVFDKPEKRFINQILQIGAVKLDENFGVTEKFKRIIRSDISNKVTGRFAELTGITSDIMKDGVPLRQAVEDFNEFSHDCRAAMTWSDSDLYAIVENEKLLLGGSLRFEMNNYLDVQKLVQNKMRTMGYDSRNQVSLENAAGFFGINTERFSMHDALDDSRVCAELLRICYSEEVFNSLLRDARSADFRERFSFKPYAVSDINDSRIDRSKFRFQCPGCGTKLRRISKWKYRNRWFTAGFLCPVCGTKYTGRVMVKVTFDGSVYKKRLTKIQRKEKNDEMPVMPQELRM